MTHPIETRALRKVYHPSRRNELVGLDGLDLEVKAGDIFGFIGPNGAGKSTTIKILVGLVWPTSGEATLLGHPAGSVAARKQLGYLPEIANYHEFMGVGELLEVHAHLAGIGSAERTNLCKDALEVVGLGHRWASTIRELSKGMKQRFGIAQALVANPPLLILDELTSGLDPLAQKELKDVILSLKRRGMTIFFSSHKLTEVEHICDFIGIVHRGKLLRASPLEEFLTVDTDVDIQFKGENSVSDKVRSDGFTPQLVEGVLQLTLSRDRVDAAVDSIRQANGQVWSVQPHRLNLEDAFFNLISKQETTQLT